MLKKLLDHIKGKKEAYALSRYLEFVQDGKTYNLYDMPDGFVIKGDVDLSEKGLTELPDLSKVTVTGYFDCSHNALTSLQGAPKMVGGNFVCRINKLVTLQGAPEVVGGHFFCSPNPLKTLEGAPRQVGGDFDCKNCRLTSLDGAPEKVGKTFDCSRNNLTNLQGSPKEVGELFNCTENPLSTLEGAPEKVDGYFFCCGCNLTSLKGAPQKVGRGFDCQVNQLTSLEGAPQEVGEYFNCEDNKLTSLLHIPLMKYEEVVRCDAKVAKQYGFSKGKFTAEALYESTQYLSEAGNKTKIEILKQKIADGKKLTRSEEQVLEQAKHRAGYAAFKKRMAKEREE